MRTIVSGATCDNCGVEIPIPVEENSVAMFTGYGRRKTAKWILCMLCAQSLQEALPKLKITK